jgi:hypothetical protein
MQMYIFRSDKDPAIAGFTTQRHGGNLPAEFAPWRPPGGAAIQTGDEFADVTGGADVVLAGIARDGFYLAMSEGRVTSRSQPPSR